MDQNQTTDNKLEQAIDDIINAEPVFSDPVAAPSSIPEGDTGKLGAPVGPFPDIAMIEPAPEPIAPLQSMDIPELNVPPMPPAEPAAPVPTPEPAMPTPTMPEPITPEPTMPTTTPVAEPEVAPVATPSQPGDAAEIKKAALRDLAPLLDKVNMDTTKKFGIYKNILDDLKDYSVLDSASRTAREISDETERAEALLYLIESIDRM